MRLIKVTYVQSGVHGRKSKENVIDLDKVCQLYIAYPENSAQVLVISFGSDCLRYEFHENADAVKALNDFVALMRGEYDAKINKSKSLFAFSMKDFEKVTKALNYSEERRPMVDIGKLTLEDCYE
jgi:hypothetical protein